MSVVSDLSPEIWLKADADCKTKANSNCSNQDKCFKWLDQSGNSNDVEVETAALCDSDFNEDGEVDGADFLIWQANNPTASGATKADGDADGDGDVDGQDFLVWQTEFGTKCAPEYITNVLNSKPGLLFSKDAAMVGPTGVLSGEMTLFIVFRPTVNVGNNTRFCDQGGEGFGSHPDTNWLIDGTDFREVNFQYFSSTKIHGVWTGNTDPTVPAISQTEAQIITAYMDGTRAGIRLDGDAATESPTTDDCSAGGKFRVRPHNTPMYYFEIIGFDYALSASEMEDVEDYLRDQWDISS